MADNILHWRLLEDRIADPFLHFAVEETLLRRVAEGRSEPTLRLRHTVPSVWLGVYQDPSAEVDLAACRTKGLPVVRRPNPGGAVYQDAGTFCYSAMFRKHPTFEALGIHQTHELYRIFGDLVVGLCATFGVTAETSPGNDVLVGGRKVYGSAQIELGDAVAHSGTFLVQADLEVMASVLRPASLKFSDKDCTRLRDRVVNLAEVVGRPLSAQEVMAQLPREWAARLPVVLHPGTLTDSERREAESLWREKYAMESWTFPRRRPFSTSLATKASSGLVQLDLVLEGDRISSIEVGGDFLLARQETLASFLRSAKDRTIPEALEQLSQSSLPTDLRQALAHLLMEGAQRPALEEANHP